MSRKLSILDRLELWLNMDRATIQIAVALVIIGICAFGFSRYGQMQNEQQTNTSMYTESAKIESIEYEKIFGYAPMDSAVPPVTGIKANYTYQVNNRSFTAKQTFYKKGFRVIKKITYNI